MPGFYSSQQSFSPTFRIIRVVKADREQQEKLAGLRDVAEVTDLEEALGRNCCTGYFD